MPEVVVIGGGLAGLISSILLNRAGFDVSLVEKKRYPFHRVCGEYISNEVVPFLQKHDLFPDELHPTHISNFTLSDVDGRTMHLPLDMGAFGLSRYQFDAWLATKAHEEGVKILQQTSVQSVHFEKDHFVIASNDRVLKSDYVIGAFGKRSNLDRMMKRPFFQKRSPYIGVKYHVTSSLVEPDRIYLHNFEGGYCGTSQVENGITNICYLAQRELLKSTGDVGKMQEKFLFVNPRLKALFEDAESLFDTPEVINEISFAPKEPVYDHILMAGDAAGMITPLSGNGMAMAIHGAKLVSEALIDHVKKGTSREELEQSYQKIWNRTFKRRHWIGRQLQSGLFGSKHSSRLAVTIGQKSKPLATWLMKQTHGEIVH